MTEKKKVVIVGWNPDVVDYTKWPGLTPEKLRTALEGDRNNLNNIGYDAELLYIDNAETAFDVVANALKQESYDCVLIGAGVRTDQEHFIVFERLVNAAHQHAPQASICFNTNPGDTAEAVQRWV